MTLGELIKKYRAEHDLSLRDFAKKSGISNSYLSMIETGRKPSSGRPIVPTLTKLNQLADAMEMRVDDLVLLIDDTIVDLRNNDSELTYEERHFLELYRLADKRTKRLIQYALLLSDE